MEPLRDRTADADKFEFANLGDANLERQFETPDLVEAFINGKIWRQRHREYSVRASVTGTAAENSTWMTG